MNSGGDPAINRAHEKHTKAPEGTATGVRTGAVIEHRSSFIGFSPFPLPVSARVRIACAWEDYDRLDSRTMNVHRLPDASF
jgi:hypothetical protein